MVEDWIGDAKPNREDKRCGSNNRAQSDLVVRNVGGGKEVSGSVKAATMLGWRNIKMRKAAITFVSLPINK